MGYFNACLAALLSHQAFAQIVLAEKFKIQIWDGELLRSSPSKNFEFSLCIFLGPKTEKKTDKGIEFPHATLMDLLLRYNLVSLHHCIPVLCTAQHLVVFRSDNNTQLISELSVWRGTKYLCPEQLLYNKTS